MLSRFQANRIHSLPFPIPFPPIPHPPFIPTSFFPISVGRQSLPSVEESPPHIQPRPQAKKHGKLIKLRTTMLDWTPENMSNFITQRPGLEKIWYVPKLRLPVSGFEMKEVALMVSRDRNGGGCGGVWEEFEGSSDDALDGGFEDDEHGIFGEAMTQILTKLPLKTTYS